MNKEQLKQEKVMLQRQMQNLQQRIDAIDALIKEQETNN